VIGRYARVIVLGAVAAAGAACSPTAPTPPPPRIIARPIQVDSVEVALAPPSAHVRGVIGDGCTELAGVTTSRSENRVTVTILSTRPEEAICIQIAKLYDATLALPGDYPPGQYVLRVNSVEKTFTVP
jgi:hypothetical protein